MPKITIDGKEFEAQAGQTIIQVAMDNGIDGTIVYQGVADAFGMKWEDSHKYIK